MTRRTVFLAVMLALALGCGGFTPANLSERGLKELRRGQYDQAIATCTEAMRSNPDDAEAYLYRGRAYQLRSAMGDPQRAIADLTEAIRLAPDSSDAYYYRSLVYRDLGKTELAATDDMKARQVDGRLQQVYRGLPDPLAPATPEKMPEEVAADEPRPSSPLASGGSLLKTKSEQRKEYERLKKRFEPFGTPRTDEFDATESPIARYRRLLREPVTVPDQYESPLGNFGALGSQAPRLSQPDEPAGRLRRPTPLSPFQPRVGSGLAADPRGRLASPFGGQLQSPFPQRAPAPTGYVAPPANPFAQQSFGPFSQQPRPSSSEAYSNPAVRPPYPRDYIP